MSFLTTEKSLNDAAPVELYEFIGTFGTVRYTSHGKEITNSLGTFTPAVVSRNAIESTSQDQEDISIEISLPYTDPIINQYVFRDSPPELEVTIYRAHLNNVNDFILMWKGKPISFSVDKRKAKLKVPSSLSYILSGQCPSPRYQAPCNHVLYDARCGIERNDNTHVTYLTADNLESVVVPLETIPYAASELIGGELRWNGGGQRRMIIDANANSVTVANRFSTEPDSGDMTGTELWISRGCDRSMGVCHFRFDNAVNFGGFNLVPSTNPFQTDMTQFAEENEYFIDDEENADPTVTVI